MTGLLSIVFFNSKHWISLQFIAGLLLEKSHLITSIKLLVRAIMIETIETKGSTLSWLHGNKRRIKNFSGDVFYAAPLNSKNAIMFVVITRESITSKDRFYLVNGLGDITHEIFTHESFPVISSLYAVEKCESECDVIISSSSSKFGRDLAIRFDPNVIEFTSWREHW